MISVIFGLLVGAALIGLYLATRHFCGSPPPVAHALAHGPVGFTAFVLLLYMIASGQNSIFATIAALTLGAGMAIGMMMFLAHRTGQSPPKLMISIHAVLGALAIAFVGHLARYW